MQPRRTDGAMVQDENQQTRSVEDISVVILARNEELAIQECIDSVRNLDADIVVIDSASRDDTVTLAQQAGARVVQFAWNGRYPKKKEWALRNSGLSTDWVLLLDADERATPALLEELRIIARSREFD